MQRGFSTLFLVIVVGSVALSLALWTSTSNLWSIRASFDNKASAQARALANACAETALEHMREDESYTGSGTKSIEDDTCTYEIINTGDDTRTVRVESAVDNFVRKIDITTDAFNPIHIITWQEVK